jgi:hypothetical protein
MAIGATAVAPAQSGGGHLTMRRGRKIAKVDVARDWQFVCTECEGTGATIACVIDVWFRHLLWNHLLRDSKEQPPRHQVA